MSRSLVIWTLIAVWALALLLVVALCRAAARPRRAAGRVPAPVRGDVMATASAPVPRRIQMRRTKGWRKPDGAIVVARPRPWGNPFRAGKSVGWHWDNLRGSDAQHLRHLRDADHVLTRADAVDAFRTWIALAVGRSGSPRVDEARTELAGHDLACWCSLDQPCHADVLLTIANSAVAPSGTGRVPVQRQRAVGDKVLPSGRRT